MTRLGRGHRAGVSLIYTTAVIFVLIGFVSLAIDIGRVQLARTELRTAADGAAELAGGTALRTDLDEAEARALEIAEANKCNGDAIDLIPDEDISFGKWHYYTRTFESAEDSSTHVNAMRVIARRVAARDSAISLVFARALGIANKDVAAGAVVMITGGRATLGIVGIDSLRMVGNSMTDSYNSNNGSYNPAHPLEHGDIASNGVIDMSGTVDVHGSVHTGPDGDLSVTNNVTITGDEYPFPEPLSYPAVNATPYATSNNNSLLSSTYFKSNTRDLTIGANKTYTLPGTNDTAHPVIYYIRNFTIHGTATLSLGKNIVMYVTGDIDISGNCGSTGNLPSDFQINVAGTGKVTLAGSGTQTKATYATIYAPQATVELKGNHNLYGAVVGKTLDIVGTSEVHYDEALGKENTWPETVQLVG